MEELTQEQLNEKILELEEKITGLENEKTNLAEELNNSNLKINELQTLNQKLFLRVSTSMNTVMTQPTPEDVRSEVINEFKIKERKNGK